MANLRVQAQIILLTQQVHPVVPVNTATVTITVNVPPIVLDLNDNGIELIALEHSQVAWPFPCGNNHFIGWVGPEDGILVYDYDNDGKITKLDEFSFVSYHPDAKTDLDGLRLAFDSNHDGIFDINDEHFSQFAVLARQK